MNLHYDLEVNIAGIEVIARLLQTVRRLQEENRKLQSGYNDRGIEIGFTGH
ncbi:hypothetical protein D3C72_2532400 [compost metagenome]